jgi:hypothetical protein
MCELWVARTMSPTEAPMRQTLKKLSVPLVLLSLLLPTACETSLQAGTCAGDMRITADDALANAARCDCVGGSLIIEGSMLKSLDAGAGLTCVEGALVIRKNPELVDLSGLLGLERIGGSVVIRDNPVLTPAAIDRLTTALVSSGAVDGSNVTAFADDGNGQGPIDDEEVGADAENDDVDGDDLVEDGDPLEDDDVIEEGEPDDVIDAGDADDDIEEGEVGDEDEEEIVCEGDAACAEAELDAAVLAFSEAILALVAQIDVAVALAAQGEEEAAIVAIEEALVLVELAGDAFGDVFSALVVALFAGVDGAVLWDAVEAAFGAVDDAEDALWELFTAIAEDFDLGAALGECGEAGDLLEELLDDI